MALLTWTSKYSVGVQSIDSQHTVLFDLINELHAAMLSGKAQSITGALLRKLVNYTRDHFASEEAMMTAAKFPGLGQHRIQHRNLTKQVEEFAARHERGESALNIHLLNFLRDWLTNHIQQVDKEYAPWMNQHNIR